MKLEGCSRKMIIFIDNLKSFKMSYSVYIIYSESTDLFYIGQTENLSVRLDMHCNENFKGSFTSKAKDWKLYYFLECSTREQALKIEQHIKKNRTRKYYQSLKIYPEISEKLIDKYSVSLPR